MSIAVMLSGSISKQPETRQTSKGNPFAFTTVRVPSQEGDTYASVTAFDSALMDTLTQLKPGDPVTVVGAGKLSIYTPAHGGDPRPSLSVTASRIVCLSDRQAAPRPMSDSTNQPASLVCHPSKRTTTSYPFEAIIHEVHRHPAPSRRPCRPGRTSATG